MKLIYKVAYFQGLIEDPDNPDLDFYLQFYPPWLARLLVQYRPLRVTLQFLRNSISIAAIVTTSITVISSAIALVKFADNKSAQAQNAFSICMCVPVITIVSSVYFQKKKVKKFLDNIEEIERRVTMGNEDHVVMKEKMEKFWYNITRVSIFVVYPLNTLWVTIIHVVNLLPNRKHWENLWYPYDETKSPAYEITLVLRWIQIVTLSVSTNTCLAFLGYIFAQLSLYFKILCMKLEDIQNTSIRNMCAKNIIYMDFSFIKSFLCREDVSEIEIDNENHKEILEDVVEEEECCSIEIQSDEEIAVDPETLESSIQIEAINYSMHFDELLETISIPSATLTMVTQNTEELFNAEITTHINQSFDQNVGQPLDKDLVVKRQLEDCAKELDKEMVQEVVECVKIHQILLTLCRSLEMLMEPVLIVVFLMMVSVYGLDIVLLSKDNFSMHDVGFVALTIYSSINYFLLNNEFNKITDQSESVVEAAYSCDWMGASPAFKRYMLILMTRANVAVEFKPVGLDPLSVANFAQVCKIAYNSGMSFRDIVKKQ